jgi:hypothetical protein
VGSGVGAASGGGDSTRRCTVHKRGEVRTDERGGVGDYSKVK